MLGMLAYTSLPDGRVHLNDTENWNVNSLLIRQMVIDIESVVMHPIGHLLNLCHSFDIEAIMYLAISFGSRKVQLVADVEGLQ